LETQTSGYAGRKEEKAMTLSVLVYGSIMLGCLLFFVFSLLFSSDVEVDHDVDFHDGGDGHGGGHDDIPRFLSLRNIFLFGVGFGAVGAISASYGYPTLVSNILGVLSGFVSALIGWGMFVMLYKQQGSTTQNMSKLIGKSGRVTIKIPTSGVGQILVENEYGTPTHVTAESLSGFLPVGKTVSVVKLIGDRVQVQISS